ncbi:hypothetical protein F5Y18DRAFT_429180 [Xylariaceae sp. FL1019]|nr:hypothetical protein F5Y18DRAFT_429180 [Xylariaceae sp. FL1019]
MAAQQPLWPHHYWDLDQNARLVVTELIMTPYHHREDVVWLAWAEICAVYFRPGEHRHQHCLRQDEHSNQPCKIQWHVVNPAYRGHDNVPDGSRPDIVVVKKFKDHSIRHYNPYLHWVARSRDYLWIECKSKSNDIPHLWKNAIEQLLKALAIGAKDGLAEMYCIVAIGFKWICFKWSQDNYSTRPTGVLYHRGQHVWNIEYAHCLFDLQDQYCRLNEETGQQIIDTKQAYSLRKGPDNKRLEEFLKEAHDHRYASGNPYHYLA